MASPLESLPSTPDNTRDSHSGGWLGVGIIAAASALVGGVAAAWYYRKTLIRLLQAQPHAPDFEAAHPEDNPDEDV
jgi:membrane associated rhomboid family serine protease